MNAALKIFVCGFSFVFSAFFCYAVFAILIAVVSGPFANRGQTHFALVSGLMPLAPAIYAGYRAARVALTLEQKRQDRARTRKQ